MHNPNAAMAQATRAFQTGNYEVARQIASQLAATNPANPMVLQLLGLAQTHSGDPKSGLKNLDRALTLAPQDSQLRFNVANALLSAGEAFKALKTAKKLPDDPPVLHLRALASKAIGRRKDAASNFSALMEKSPSDLGALNNFANFLCDEKEYERAIVLFQKATALDPGSGQIRLNLGLALDGAGRHVEALDAFRKAANLGLPDAGITFELAKSFIKHGEHAEALPLLARARSAGLSTPELLTLVGICQLAVQDREGAEKSFDEALSLEPGYPRAILNLGIMLEQGNRIDEFREFVTLVDDKPEPSGEIAYLKALLLRRDKRFEEALDLALTVKTDALDEALLAEFIAKLQDRLGQHELAFASFERMNAVTAAWPIARRMNAERGIERIREGTAHVTRDWYSGFSAPPPFEGRAPVFLGGFLRSGTTLLDTILMGHADAEVREEEDMIYRMEEAAGPVQALPTLPASRIEAMRAAYFREADRLRMRERDKLFVDKNPMMTLRAAHIHRAFPDAKHVFTLRHPCDVVLSCFMQNFQVSEDRVSFLDIENAARMYDAVMAHWEQCLAVMPLDVHTIRYEAMVDDLEAQLRPLVAFLDLEWDDALLDHQTTAKERGHIRTPSYAQVTESLYTRSRGRWENYREQMAPALPHLAPWVDKFGYEPL